MKTTIKVLAELKRFSLLAIETLILGPSSARFLYWMSSQEPLDPQATWQRFTQPGGSAFEWVMSNYPPPMIRQLFLDLYYRRTFNFKDHRAGISEHYDLSNRFYELFLDKKYMFYSGADFHAPGETIEAAQEHKADYIINLIEPHAGESILDLGCGWGSMLKKIFDRTQDREHLYGYTLSTEQEQFIEEKYGFHVELKDFIAATYLDESFDKIVSIGSIEHVREFELLPLAQKLAKAIKPDGRIVHQFFCQAGKVFPTRLLPLALVIFPGSELTNLKQHLDTFAAAKLQVTHHSIHDYRPTLKAWFDRLVENQEAAIQLVGVQTYNKYLCYLAESWRLFNDCDLMLMRFVLKREDLVVQT